jgi:hypothetical protein
MQFPDVVNTEGTTNAFLDSFLRGNRDDQPRRDDGSILQALNLMNAGLIENKFALTGATASPLLVDALKLNNTDAVNKLFLTILARYPSAAEMTTAMGACPPPTARRATTRCRTWPGRSSTRSTSFSTTSEGRRNEQRTGKINRWFRKYGWNHQTFFNRPHATRRHFLELMGSGVTASFLRSTPRRRPRWLPPELVLRERHRT